MFLLARTALSTFAAAMNFFGPLTSLSCMWLPEVRSSGFPAISSCGSGPLLSQRKNNIWLPDRQPNNDISKLPCKPCRNAVRNDDLVTQVTEFSSIDIPLGLQHDSRLCCSRANRHRFRPRHSVCFSRSSCSLLGGAAGSAYSANEQRKPRIPTRVVGFFLDQHRGNRQCRCIQNPMSTRHA